MESNRLQRCFNYHLKGFLTPSLIFLGIMILVDIILPAAVHLANGSIIIRTGATMPGWQFLSVIYMFAASIFMFVGASASFRETFNYLLAMNNTRRNQFFGAQGAGLIIAAIHTILVAVVGLLEHLLHSWFAGVRPFTAATEGWAVGPYLSGLLLAFVVFIAAHALGEAVGILSYRFGRKFILPFWICFGMSFVLIPILVTSLPGFADFLAWYVGAGSADPVLPTALHIIFTAIVLKGISFIFIRKLPQMAS